MGCEHLYGRPSTAGKCISAPAELLPLTSLHLRPNSLSPSLSLSLASPSPSFPRFPFVFLPSPSLSFPFVLLPSSSLPFRPLPRFPFVLLPPFHSLSFSLFSPSSSSSPPPSFPFSSFPSPSSLVSLLRPPSLSSFPLRPPSLSFSLASPSPPSPLSFLLLASLSLPSPSFPLRPPSLSPSFSLPSFPFVLPLPLPRSLPSSFLSLSRSPSSLSLVSPSPPSLLLPSPSFPLRPPSLSPSLSLVSPSSSFPLPLPSSPFSPSLSFSSLLPLLSSLPFVLLPSLPLPLPFVLLPSPLPSLAWIQNAPSISRWQLHPAVWFGVPRRQEAKCVRRKKQKTVTDSHLDRQPGPAPLPRHHNDHHSPSHPSSLPLSFIASLNPVHLLNLTPVSRLSPSPLLLPRRPLPSGAPSRLTVPSLLSVIINIFIAFPALPPRPASDGLRRLTRLRGRRSLQL
ncbi:hypothetical protein C7M84_019305 [Penaeus vannamei]|uniref:Uncharacterized protein n=1 Tax=Penaeus vannamei TaxID=6689 RepID=A0A3R7MT45_PENVA|nr:hypothetical protein C7M84_019305 [Penaeus vannamei]